MHIYTHTYTPREIHAEIFQDAVSSSWLQLSGLPLHCLQAWLLDQIGMKSLGKASQGKPARPTGGYWALLGLIGKTWLLLSRLAWLSWVGRVSVCSSSKCVFLGQLPSTCLLRAVEFA